MPRAGATPAKRAKRATVTAEWLFWSSTVRLRIRDLMLTRARPPNIHEQHTRHESRGWHSDKEQP